MRNTSPSRTTSIRGSKLPRQEGNTRATRLKSPAHCSEVDNKAKKQSFRDHLCCTSDTGAALRGQRRIRKNQNMEKTAQKCAVVSRGSRLTAAVLCFVTSAVKGYERCHQLVSSVNRQALLFVCPVRRERGHPPVCWAVGLTRRKGSPSFTQCKVEL